MPSFAIEMTSDGANIKVGVSAPEGYVTRTTPPRTWVATIDTGASISFVSPAVVAAIEPPHVGRASFLHMNGCSEVDIVLVMIRLGGHDFGGKWFLVDAGENASDKDGVDVILGMDLLTKLNMKWKGKSRLGSLGY